MKTLLIVFDCIIMAVAISLAKNGYNSTLLITIVSIVSYSSGYIVKDLE